MAAAKDSLFTARLFLKPSKARIRARSQKSPAEGNQRVAAEWNRLVVGFRKLEIRPAHT